MAAAGSPAKEAALLRADLSSVPTLLLTEPQAAVALSLTTAALRRLRYRGGAPAVVRVGDRVLYTIDDLKDWIERHRISSSAPQPVTQLEPQAARRPGRPSVRDRQAAATRALLPPQEAAS